MPTSMAAQSVVFGPFSNRVVHIHSGEAWRFVANSGRSDPETGDDEDNDDDDDDDDDDWPSVVVVETDGILSEALYNGCDEGDTSKSLGTVWYPVS